LAISGPGEIGLSYVCGSRVADWSAVGELGTGRGLLHISQFRNPGWLANVHRGHVIDPEASFEGGSAGGGLEWLALLATDAAARCVFPAMAALRTCLNSGLIPHVRHGGNGKASVAMVGSKLDGTGLRKEQIGQIHVPLSTCGEGACTGGLGTLETGDDAD
jgi:hypothetical protein